MGLHLYKEDENFPVSSSTQPLCATRVPQCLMDMDGQVITLLEFQLLASLVRLSLAQKALKLFCRNAQVLPAQDRNRVSNKQGGIPNEGFR